MTRPVRIVAIGAGLLLLVTVGRAGGPDSDARPISEGEPHPSAASQAQPPATGDDPPRERRPDVDRTPSEVDGEVRRTFRGADGEAGRAPERWERARPPRSFTLVATGDVLLHSPLWNQAQSDAAAAGQAGFDFGPLLADVRPTIAAADLAICHLETPVAPAGGPYSGYPVFSVPPSIVPTLADVGYDACTTASNHTYDQGADGVDRTLDALDAAGIRHTGSARSPGEADAITFLEADGARVALLSYTFSFNGIPAPDGQAWRSNPIDEASILADAGRARGQGADVVVVSLHWGDEYDHDPNVQQDELAPRLIRSPDIDLLLGHHAHVAQPLQEIEGEWIVYGMGNLVATHATPGAPNEEGLMVRFTFTERAEGWEATGAEYAPVLMVKDRTPIRLVDVARRLADPATGPRLQERLELAQDRTAFVVNSRGAAEAGLQPIAPATG